jgi:hypothetical protein
MLRSVWPLVVIVCGLAFAAPAAAAPQPYPVLVERDGLRVYGPVRSGTWGRCPRAAQPVRDRDLRVAARAALLAVPRLYRNDKQIDVRGATARSARLGTAVWTRWGLARSTCGRRAEARTIAVGVGFPRVNWSASLSSATFFVSRVRDGWVIWHQAH